MKPRYGSVLTRESFFDGEKRSVERSFTEAFDTATLFSAQEMMLDLTKSLIGGGIAKNELTFKLDLDNERREVKRVHVTYILSKETIEVKKT